MDKHKGSDFVDFGTYSAAATGILEKELAKQGIAVKVEYPGTNIGRESTAHAYFTAWTLLIQANEIPRAEKVLEKFNIKPIKEGEVMPLPKTYTWAKQGLGKYALIVFLLSFVAIVINGSFGLAVDETQKYLMFIFSISLFLWLVSVAYNILRKR